MKNIPLITGFLIGFSSLFAQPVFEKTLNESATLAYLESKGEVYFALDVINKECHIYDMDLALYKTIALPVPEGYYLYDIQYLSEQLFNSDQLIELAYIYSKYVPTTGSYYYTYETKLINENGSVLETFPGAGHTMVHETIGHGKKFLVYEYNYSVIPYRTYTHIYSLPESGTKSVEYSVKEAGTDLPYPNPAKHQVHIPVQLPKGISSAELTLYNLNGQVIGTYPISDADENLLLSTRQLSAGTYLYSIQSESWQSESKKLVIQ